MTVLRVLIAPDCFGDSLTAVAAAEAIAAGWRSARPDDVLKLAPQSDGGPGFVDVLAARNGTRHRVPVAGPLADTVDADWVSIGDTAYLESAQACGLALLPGPPTPLLSGDSATASDHLPVQMEFRNPYAPALAPIITVGRLNGGVFGFDFKGLAGRPVVVEASTNLQTWVAIQTNIVGTGVTPFTESPFYGQRFYRLRAQ